MGSAITLLDGEPAQLVQHLALGDRRWQPELLEAPHAAGDGGIDQRVKGLVAEGP